MRLKDYARNHRERKDYVQQPGLLMVRGLQDILKKLTNLIDMKNDGQRNFHPL